MSIIKGIIIIIALVALFAFIEYLFTYDDAQTWEKRRKYHEKYHEWPWW